MGDETQTFSAGTGTHHNFSVFELLGSKSYGNSFSKSRFGVIQAWWFVRLGRPAIRFGHRRAKFVHPPTCRIVDDADAVSPGYHFNAKNTYNLRSNVPKNLQLTCMLQGILQGFISQKQLLFLNLLLVCLLHDLSLSFSTQATQVYLTCLGN